MTETKPTRQRDTRAARYGITEYTRQKQTEPCGWSLRLGDTQAREGNPHYSKVFLFEDYGGKIKALKAAQAKRAEVMAQPEFVAWFKDRIGGRQKPNSNTVTGVRGVNYTYANRKRGGETYKVPILLAQDTGKNLGSWPLSKYDPKTAFFRAVRKRDTVEAIKHTPEQIQTLYENWIECVRDELMEYGIEIHA